MTLQDTGGRIAEWLSESTHVLIGAGAGLSVAAGIDYTDEADFARRFPALLKYGVRARYQMIGFGALSAAEFWGYWAAHVHDIRFTDRHALVYEQLQRLVGAKDSFVLTSNVDAMFVRHGFEASRVCSIQGDYAFMQCLRPCRAVVWPSLPVLSQLLRHRDPDTQAVAKADILPTCPECGGGVFLNVRAGRWFIEEPYRKQFDALKTWAEGLGDGSGTLVFDIGSGFNTPSVVRWPVERLAARLPKARFVRINPQAPEVPEGLSSRAIGVRAGAAETVSVVMTAMTSGSRGGRGDEDQN